MLQKYCRYFSEHLLKTVTFKRHCLTKIFLRISFLKNKVLNKNFNDLEIYSFNTLTLYQTKETLQLFIRTESAIIFVCAKCTNNLVHFCAVCWKYGNKKFRQIAQKSSWFFDTHTKICKTWRAPIQLAPGINRLFFRMIQKKKLLRVKF